jgi:glycosyltransferase involved in cell wall biosynthesis
MLEAMTKLKDFNVKLYVVGEFYDDKEKYEKQIKDYGLQNSVVVNSDYVANDKVGVYFSAADVVMLPYISATQSGIAQIAYNFNKPVIATNVGGLGEVVHDNVTGFVVEPNNADAIANAVRRYFDENREAEFAAKVELEKKKYSWETMTNAIEEFMR